MGVIGYCRKYILVRKTKALTNLYGCSDRLTLLVLQIKTGTCTNSVDPDETARNEPSHLDLHCLSSVTDV